jgi:hypothetical protein
MTQFGSQKNLSVLIRSLTIHRVAFCGVVYRARFMLFGKWASVSVANIAHDLDIKTINDTENPTDRHQTVNGT